MARALFANDNRRSLMDEPGALRLTFEGKLALDGVKPQAERDVRFSSLGGASVRVKLPHSWEYQGHSAHVLFEHDRESPAGFQRAPRGAGLFQLLGEHERVHPDNIVSMGDGVLAHYLLDWGSEAVSGFTLWQGRWSDVYTADYEGFEEALAAFQRFAPQDARTGAVIERPTDWRLSEDGVTVDCVALVLNMHRRDEAMLAPWEGSRGEHVEMYRVGGHDEGVLAVSPSAVALIGRGGGHEAVADDHVADIAQHLLVEWRAPEDAGMQRPAATRPV